MNNEKPHPKSKSGLLWIIVILVVLLAGGFGIYQVLSRGHQAVVPIQAEVRVKIPPVPVTPKGVAADNLSSRPEAPDQDPDSAAGNHETLSSSSSTPDSSVEAGEPAAAGPDEPTAPAPPQADTNSSGETAMALNQTMKSASPEAGGSMDVDRPPTAEPSQVKAPMAPPVETTPSREEAGDLVEARPDAGTDQNTANTQLSRPYTIQVGAFRTKANAEKSTAQLKSKGYDSYLDEIKDKNQRAWYLVRFGHFQDRSTAVKALATFKKQENMAGQITSLKTR